MVGKETLKALIAQHRNRLPKSTGLVQREAMDQLMKLAAKKEVVLITGVRRSGKSSLMRMVATRLVKEQKVPLSNILYLNFEDERLLDFETSDFAVLQEAFLELGNPTGKTWFFLDEIQHVPHWQRWVNRLYEFEDIKIMVTGSNADLLSPEASMSLTGRNRQLAVFPFSFREFLRAKKIEVSREGLYDPSTRAKVVNAFASYYEQGGFPEAVLHPDPGLLQQYFKDIVYRDIIVRHGLRNVKEVRELALFLASNTASVHSLRTLQKVINAKSPNTIKSYVAAFTDVYLFSLTSKFDYSLKKQLYNPSKIYMADTGLCRSVSFRFSENKGRMLETIVALQLMRMDCEFFYWRSAKDKEVDFVWKRGNTIHTAIQVTLSLIDPLVRERELAALEAARKELNPKELYILTWDEEGEMKIGRKRVKIKPVWKWLLDF